MEIYKSVKAREGSKTIPLNDVMKDLGISEDELV